MTKLLLDQAIDLDDFVGQIEALDAGTLVGWAHKKDGDCPLEILAVSPAGHARGTASRYRPDVLFRQGNFENPGFQINLGSVADETSSNTQVRLFCVTGGERHLAAELSFPTQALIESREFADVSLNHDRQLHGRFITNAHDEDEVPELVLENARGDTVRLSPQRVSNGHASQEGTVVWEFEKQLKLAFIVERLPLRLHREIGTEVHCLADNITVECLYHLTVNQDSVSGWAISPDEPAHRVLVRMRDGNGDLIDETRTILHRSDLARITGLDGFFGFKLARPPETTLSLEMLRGPKTIAGPMVLRWPKTSLEAA